jgi:outer membrane protein W
MVSAIKTKEKINMKNYKKLIAALFCAASLLFATSAFSADTATAGSVIQSSAVQSTSLFNGNEFGLSLSSAYVVDRSAPFQKDYSANLTVGASYFPSRYLGFEANLPVYQSAGSSIDEVQSGLIIRLPLATTIPLLRNIAPYIGAGGVYNWDTAQNWAYIGKTGVEVRINNKWGVFFEGQYRNNQFSDMSKGSTAIAGGIRFVF